MFYKYQFKILKYMTICNYNNYLYVEFHMVSNCQQSTGSKSILVLLVMVYLVPFKKLFICLLMQMLAWNRCYRKKLEVTTVPYCYKLKELIHWSYCIVQMSVYHPKCHIGLLSTFLTPSLVYTHIKMQFYT